MPKQGKVSFDDSQDDSADNPWKELLNFCIYGCAVITFLAILGLTQDILSEEIGIPFIGAFGAFLVAFTITRIDIYRQEKNR